MGNSVNNLALAGLSLLAIAIIIMATGKKLMEEKWYKDFSFMHFQFVREVKKKERMSRKSNQKVVVFADTETHVNTQYQIRKLNHVFLSS